MISKRVVFLLTAITLLLAQVQGQEKADTVKSEKKQEKPVPLTPYHKNVIKFNPTPMLLFGNIRNITLSYERLITKNQSLSLQAGYLLFPKIVDDTLAYLVTLTGGEKHGVNLALDYRYYPFSRNRRPAPDGLYIGGYFSYYGYRFKNDFDVLYTTVDQQGQLNGRLNMYNLGIELGYQFIFWKRFSLDLLLFGPSLSYVHGQFHVSGDLDPEQIQILDEEVVQKLLQRFPQLKTIFSDEGLTFTGYRTKLTTFFRYSIQLGVHF